MLASVAQSLTSFVLDLISQDVATALTHLFGIRIGQLSVLHKAHVCNLAAMRVCPFRFASAFAAMSSLTEVEHSFPLVAWARSGTAHQPVPFRAAETLGIRIQSLRLTLDATALTCILSSFTMVDGPDDSGTATLERCYAYASLMSLHKQRAWLVPADPPQQQRQLASFWAAQVCLSLCKIEDVLLVSLS